MKSLPQEINGGQEEREYGDEEEVSEADIPCRQETDNRHRHGPQHETKRGEGSIGWDLMSDDRQSVSQIQQPGSEKRDVSQAQHSSTPGIVTSQPILPMKEDSDDRT